ncbi:amidohydrolase family protein [Histidinibacterium aquaticum]|uniref:Amidohydrolase family protein n=1 Tax=Histidinibacterium aquaticum TaxID=2613962 RepID=A0A5J5GR62_9RHOB|nr:amidohydrolase family protein [Histidinibacterium aquaticum]KAA9009994.1 amidohydrolase family protein [Histidinibacterium aquaticum]
MTTTLIRNGLVLTLAEGGKPLPGHDVLLKDGKIAEIAPGIESEGVDEVIDAEGMIVMPGLVNAHIHTWQTGLRGLALDWTATNYFRAMHAGLAGFFTPDDIRIANLVGALNQINNGVTTMVDWHHNNPTPDHSDAAIDGLEDAGIRAMFLHGSAKPDPKPGQKHFSEIPMSRSEVERLRNGRLSSDDAMVTMGMAILGPQMSVEEVVLEDLGLAKDLDLVTSIHHSGAKMPAPEGYVRAAEAGLIDRRVNVVHGNELTDRDLDILVDNGATFNVTAEIEMQICYGDLLAGRLIERGVPFSIGTDIESAYAPDMLACTRFTLQAERHLTSMRHKDKTGERPHPQPVSVRQALNWATIEGAKLARLEKRTGTLEVGKAGDVILVRANDLNMSGAFDPHNAVVGYANPGNVDTVIVQGVVHKRGGRMLRADIPKLQEALATSGRRIFEEFKERAATAEFA